MPRQICCNPFGSHKKRVMKQLRTVTDDLIDTGLVKEGDSICLNCVKALKDMPNPKDGDTGDADDTSDESDGLELFSDVGDDLDAAQQTTEECESDSDSEKEAVTDPAETAKSALNKALPLLGISPIKRRSLKSRERVSKIQKKLHAVQGALQISYDANLPERMDSQTSERLDY